MYPLPVKFQANIMAATRGICAAKTRSVLRLSSSFSICEDDDEGEHENAPMIFTSKTSYCHKIPSGQKKSRTIKSSGRVIQMIGNDYGALVAAGAAAFVLAGAGVGLSELLQPLTTALRARPNSTTMDSFFIGRRNFYCSPGKHK